MAARGAVFLVLALLLAGCSAPAPGPEAELPGEPIVSDEAPVAIVRPELVSTPTFPLDLSLAPRWLKPFGVFTVSADAPENARVAWFVEHETEEPRASVVDGEVYVLKASTPDHHDTSGPRAPVKVDDLAPDGRARAVRLAHPGRYSLDAEGARLVVNVWPNAPANAPSQAFLVEEEGAFRFEPAELDLTPSSRVLLWSQATRSVSLREAGFAAFVPLGSQGGRVTPIDEGLYRLVALALAPSGARGLASESFLVDFERPGDRIAIGPAVGRFDAAEGGAGTPQRTPFDAAFELATLVLRLNTTSLTPIPGSIHMALLREGEIVAEASSLTSSVIELADLPPGRYVVELRGEHGVLVAYELTGEGTYRMPTPARLLAPDAS